MWAAVFISHWSYLKAICLSLTNSRENHDVPGFLLPHMRKCCFYNTKGPEIVDFELIPNHIQRLLGGPKLFHRPYKCCVGS